MCNQKGMLRSRVPEKCLKIIGARAAVGVCVRLSVCGTTGRRDGRQGCKGEVARVQGGSGDRGGAKWKNRDLSYRE